MATQDSTINNDATYVSQNMLCDAEMFLRAAIRLVEKYDGEASCLINKALEEIKSAVDFLEGMDADESPIDQDVSDMLARVGKMR